jgi:hypothetical protein
MGGVHVGKPKNPTEATLSSVLGMKQVDGAPVSLRQVLPIMRVVVKGLAPLRAAKRAKPKG